MSTWNLLGFNREQQGRLCKYRTKSSNKQSGSWQPDGCQLPYFAVQDEPDCLIVIVQQSAAFRVTDFSQGFFLDLPDPFTGQSHAIANHL